MRIAREIAQQRVPLPQDEAAALLARTFKSLGVTPKLTPPPAPDAIAAVGEPITSVEGQ